MVLDAIRRIVQALRVSARAAELRWKISSAQLFVLQTLARRNAWSLNELANRTATHQSSVSVVIDKLVERKLVARARSAADRRRIELSITAAGRALVGKTPGTAQDRIIEGLALLSPADRKILARTLTALAEGVFASRERPALFFEDVFRRRRLRPRNPKWT